MSELCIQVRNKVEEFELRMPFILQYFFQRFNHNLYAKHIYADYLRMENNSK